MAEWLKAPLSKSGILGSWDRGFESRPLRQLVSGSLAIRTCQLFRVNNRAVLNSGKTKGGLFFSELKENMASNVVVKPSVQTVAKLAKALGVPMEDLVK